MASVLNTLITSPNQSKTGILSGLLFEVLPWTQTGEMKRSLIRFQVDRKLLWKGRKDEPEGGWSEAHWLL